MIRKLSQCNGFTLIEMVMVILVTAIIGMTVVVASQAAVRVSVGATFAAESQTVADTVNKALSDVLRYATEVQTDTDNIVIAYSNSGYGITDGLICIETAGDNAGRILLDDGVSAPMLLNGLSYVGLAVVPVDFMPGSSGYSADFSLQYDNGVFTGSYRLYDDVHQMLSEIFVFSFRAVNG